MMNNEIDSTAIKLHFAKKLNDLKIKTSFVNDYHNNHLLLNDNKGVSKILEVVHYQVSCRYTHEQINELKMFGVDFMQEMKSTLIENILGLIKQKMVNVSNLNERQYKIKKIKYLIKKGKDSSYNWYDFICDEYGYYNYFEFNLMMYEWARRNDFHLPYAYNEDLDRFTQCIAIRNNNPIKTFTHNLSNPYSEIMSEFEPKVNVGEVIIKDVQFVQVIDSTMSPILKLNVSLFENVDYKDILNIDQSLINLVEL